MHHTGYSRLQSAGYEPQHHHECPQCGRPFACRTPACRDREAQLCSDQCEQAAKRELPVELL